MDREMTSTASRGQLAAAISNAIVGIHSKHYGKGPTKAKTYMTDDIIVTVLEDVFTTVERTLVDQGKGDLVQEMRNTFQYTMRDQFTQAIREITGRDPRAFLSQIDWEADTAVEVFVLGNGDVPDVTQNADGHHTD
jgi:uncharacterized protein YbcI